MTRKHQPSPPSPEFSAVSSAATNRKPHRRIPRKKTRDDVDYYTDASRSQSLSNQSNEEEFEESIREDNESAYMGSESLSYSPTDHRSASTDPHFVPQNNNNYPTTTSNYASNFLNFSQPITQNSSYINIAPLPIFHGYPNECPITHLNRFSKVCRANNVSSIDMLMRIFPVTLEGEAALWYDLNIEPYPSLSWDDIKSSFLQAYHKIELIEDLRSEIMNLNQGEVETIRSYFLRLQWILKRWPEHGLSESLLKGVFVDGLKADFRDWILLQKPNSLNEALKLAFSFEQVRSIRVVEQRVLNCGFCEGKHEEQDCEVRQRMRELWIQSKEKQGSGRKEMGREFVRSVSMGGSSVGETSERQNGGVSGLNVKKSQCQCLKHQCGKKRLGRSNSIVTVISGVD
ncbi:Retrotransposon gag protein [Quillaja saponaria]|uniref:Retrotransposon gag protein n=1 Tax=Quillaja saponaria TaxID=32244 RepID=A0AAD7KZ30_QUISA|nr:Retrotransposon gag protein [Quillaja saponaria]